MRQSFQAKRNFTSRGFLISFQTKQNELKDKLNLASYLIKPVQRLGKYALLLRVRLWYKILLFTVLTATII